MLNHIVKVATEHPDNLLTIYWEVIMKPLDVLFVILLAMLFSYIVVAQELGSLRNNYEITIPEKIQNPLGEPLAAGTYSIGSGGYFETIQAAFNKLSTDGVAGEVILELIENVYITPSSEYGFLLNGPIPGAGLNSRVTIKPAENKEVMIVGNARYSLVFLDVSYLTLDGVGLTGATTLTIRALYNNTYASNDCVQFWNNSSYNIIQNITFISEDYMRYGCGIVIWNQPNSLTPPNNNLIQNNFIKEAGVGIYILGYGLGSTSPNGNIITGNKIGSETDNLIAWGIQSEITLNTIIENNIVQNIRYYNNNINPGINVYGGYGNIIRNNLVHNISADGGIIGACGILLSGYPGPGEQGSNHLVYNNMIFDIQCSSVEAGACVSGIQMWCQYSPKIYYNSVYLSGNGNGANPEGSSAIYVWGYCENVTMKNNIFVNKRDDSPYCASSVCFYSPTTLISDYNDLYYTANQINCLVDYGVSDYHTLAEWQATGQDLHSGSVMPLFIDEYLRINHHVPTFIESGGTPISGIDTDFEGDLRNISTPDIGADEFDGVVVPVELTSFTVTTNGKEVILNWSTATELNNLGFEIQRSVEGEEFFSVGFVTGYGTTTEPQNYSYSDRNLDDGNYFYRLKQVDFSGTYEYSDVVEVEWRAFNSFLLEQNYPNPFNPTTTIGFGLKEKSDVKITILNSIGEEVAVVLDEEKDSGYHTAKFNAANLSSGVYFYQLKVGDFVATKKMLLLK